MNSYRSECYTLTIPLNRWSSSRQYLYTLNTHRFLPTVQPSRYSAIYHGLRIFNYYDYGQTPLLATVFEWICMCANSPSYTPRYSPLYCIGLSRYMRSTAYSYRSVRFKLRVHNESTRRFSPLYRRRMCVNLAPFVKLVVVDDIRKYEPSTTQVRA